jgi:hypothetical protein
MCGKQPVYRSFFVRFWYETNRNTALRVIAVDTQTGKRYGFDGIDGLVQFMRKEINRLETQYEIEEEAIEERD